MRRLPTSRRAAPRRRIAAGGRRLRPLVLLVAPLVLIAVAMPAWSLTRGDEPDCVDDDTAAPLDEYGFPLDPGLLVPCDELAPDPSPPDPEAPTPALTDPDPTAGSGLTPDELTGRFDAWRSSTAAALVDEYFQRILLLSDTCDPDWFDSPYDGGLRVADGASWRDAADAALATVPGPDTRALLYTAQADFWEAGRDCDVAIEDWMESIEDGLESLEEAVDQLAALR